MIAHETDISIQAIFNEIQTNLYEAGLKWFTTVDVLNSLQDQYNKLVAQICPIEHSTFIPKISQPYYDLRQIPDFMYVSGIFNPTNNTWLEGLTYKQMKATYQ